MKTIVVFGSGSGIGASIVRLLKKDYDVYGVSKGKVNETTEYSEVDTTKLDRIERLFNNEKVDVIINCVGIGAFFSINKTKKSVYESTIDNNLTSAFNILQAGMKNMNDGGQIITISSISSIQPEEGLGVYCASKAAIDMLIKVAQKENSRLRFTIVRPGPVDTKWFEKSPKAKYYEGGPAPIQFLTPDEVALVVKNIIELPMNVRIDEIIINPHLIKNNPV